MFALWGGTHAVNFSLLQWKDQKMHNFQEETIMNDVAQSSQIYAILEEKQDEHQATMVEVEGMLFNKPISMLIDPRASQGYVSPQIVEVVRLAKTKHK